MVVVIVVSVELNILVQMGWIIFFSSVVKIKIQINEFIL